MEILIQRIPLNHLEDALKLATKVFAYEQNIPVDIIDISKELNPIWWSASIDAELIGIAACWIDRDEWYWGRFAIEQRLRGFGIGKKLAIISLKDVFNLGAKRIRVDARDVTVDLLKKLGGKVTGEPQDFYGDSVTPMSIEQGDFLNEAAQKILSSALIRCEKAQPKFAEGTSQHTLLKNRIKALYISKSLVTDKNGIDRYTKEELIEAQRQVSSIISKCEKAQLKFAQGTSHYARFHNMIKAMAISESLIIDEISKRA